MLSLTAPIELLSCRNILRIWCSNPKRLSALGNAACVVVARRVHGKLIGFVDAVFGLCLTSFIVHRLLEEIGTCLSSPSTGFERRTGEI